MFHDRNLRLQGFIVGESWPWLLMKILTTSRLLNCSFLKVCFACQFEATKNKLFISALLSFRRLLSFLNFLMCNFPKCLFTNYLHFWFLIYLLGSKSWIFWFWVFHFALSLQLECTCCLIVRERFYIVGCQGVVQLGGLVPGCSMEVALRLRLISLFYSMKVPIKFEIMNTCLI